MGTIYTSVEQLIGGTPLLELRQIQRAEGLNATLLAKLEYLNPVSYTHLVSWLMAPAVREDTMS